MQIVIDLPDDIYSTIVKQYRKDKELQTRENLYKTISNGTPIKTGHWIPMGLVDSNGNRNYECSECHHGDTHAKTQIVPYCWYCGAKMEARKNANQKYINVGVEQ